MNHATATPAEELAALRDQIARQQWLLDEQEKALGEQQEAMLLKDRQIDEQEETIAWLQERVSLLLAKRYKHSSEKDNDAQLSLLDKQELDAAINEAQKQLDEAQAAMDAADQQAEPVEPKSHGKARSSTGSKP